MLPGPPPGSSVAVVEALVVRADVLDVLEELDEELLVSSGGALVKLSLKLKVSVSEGFTLRRAARLVWASGGGSKVRVLERATKRRLASSSSVAVVVNVVVS